jgi:hypothetical protein
MPGPYTAPPASWPDRVNALLKALDAEGGRLVVRRLDDDPGVARAVPHLAAVYRAST